MLKGQAPDLLLFKMACLAFNHLYVCVHFLVKITLAVHAPHLHVY